MSVPSNYRPGESPQIQPSESPQAPSRGPNITIRHEGSVKHTEKIWTHSYIVTIEGKASFRVMYLGSQDRPAERTLLKYVKVQKAIQEGNVLSSDPVSINKLSEQIPSAQPARNPRFLKIGPELNEAEKAQQLLYKNRKNFFRNIDSEQIQILKEGLPKVTDLDLRKCDQMTEREFQQHLKNCTNLKELTLPANLITQEESLKMLKGLPLEKLTIIGKTDFTDAAIKALSEGNSKIKIVHQQQ